jgi:hypothetical protein
MARSPAKVGKAERISSVHTLRAMVNRLAFNAVELDAVRELQAGVEQPEPDDPTWEELRAVGLVDSAAGRMQLTMLGQLYRTD